MGWGSYPILFNAIGVISIFLQFMTFPMTNKKKIVFEGNLSVLAGCYIVALISIITTLIRYSKEDTKVEQK